MEAITSQLLTRIRSTRRISSLAPSSEDQTVEISSGTFGVIGRRQRCSHYGHILGHVLRSINLQVALDYNAPFLTLAAFSVLDATSPPYYTSLAPGAYDAVKPQGTPCDPAFPCHGKSLSAKAKIALAVVISVAGLAIIGLLSVFIFRSRRRRRS